MLIFIYSKLGNIITCQSVYFVDYLAQLYVAIVSNTTSSVSCFTLSNATSDASIVLY